MTTMISPAPLGQRLEDAYQAVEAALRQAHGASERVLRDKVALTEAKQAILVANAEDAKKLGSNEAARAATLDTMTVGERDALAGSEEEDRAAKHVLEVARLRLESARAQLRLESARAQLRLEELAVGIVHAARK